MKPLELFSSVNSVVIFFKRLKLSSFKVFKSLSRPFLSSTMERRLKAMENPWAQRHDGLFRKWTVSQLALGIYYGTSQQNPTYTTYTPENEEVQRAVNALAKRRIRVLEPKDKMGLYGNGIAATDNSLSSIIRQRVWRMERFSLVTRSCGWILREVKFLFGRLFRWKQPRLDLWSMPNELVVTAWLQNLAVTTNRQRSSPKTS